MQRGLQTVDGEVGPLVLNALVSGRPTVLGTHRVCNMLEVVLLTLIG